MQELLILAAFVIGTSGVTVDVVTYPAPPEEILSDEYTVSVEGKKVDVYTARTLDPPFAGKEWDFGGNYAFANFDISTAAFCRVCGSSIF